MTPTPEPNGNGQTIFGLKRIGKMLQFQLPAKYGIPLILALTGATGYAYKDTLKPGYVTQAWIQIVDKDRATNAAHRAEAAENFANQGKTIQAVRDETISNRAAIQELTRSVDRLSDRMDKLYQLLIERERSR